MGLRGAGDDSCPGMEAALGVGAAGMRELQLTGICGGSASESMLCRAGVFIAGGIPPWSKAQHTMAQAPYPQRTCSSGEVEVAAHGWPLFGAWRSPSHSRAPGRPASGHGDPRVPAVGCLQPVPGANEPVCT